jgi:hypothetical protein
MLGAWMQTPLAWISSGEESSLLLRHWKVSPSISSASGLTFWMILGFHKNELFELIENVPSSLESILVPFLTFAGLAGEGIKGSSSLSSIIMAVSFLFQKLAK